MNFTVSKKDLFEALQKVIGVVPPKTTIAILTCVLFDLKDNLLQITGTDLEISISTNIPVKGEEDGCYALPGKIMLEIVRELPDVPINIFSEMDNKITLKTDKGEYKISVQPKEDFPKIDIEEGDYSFSLNNETLYRMADKTIFAVSTDELRPALTGINMELSPGELKFVATDGHRLSKITYNNQKISENIRRNLIIPTKTMNLLMRNIEEGGTTLIKLGEDHVVFQLANSVIYSKLISGIYPNYEKVIPKQNDKKLIVNRELLLASLRRVSIFSSSLTHQVRFIISKDEISIRSEDIEYGAEGKETISAQFDGEWLQIGYNSNYLIDILRHLEGEEILFNLKDGSTAAIIEPVTQKQGEYIIMLLMPIRISEEEEQQITKSAEDNE